MYDVSDCKICLEGIGAHLAQLLIQSGGPGFSCSVTLWAEHLLVPVNKVAVAQPDHLHTETQKGDRRTSLQ